jgi:F-type H+-transporting ATPase subunit epsilon
MHLNVLLPTEVLVDETVSKIVAEAENGSFALLPRHADFTTALVPGLLVYVTAEGRERLLAVDEGILVKCGPEVMVSTQNAVRGEQPAELVRRLAARFRRLDEEQRIGRAALARLEAGVLRRFLEMEAHARG